MIKEKEQIPKPKKELTEEKKARFFQMGMKFIETHPAVAEEYFRKIDIPKEKIELMARGPGRKERAKKKEETKLTPEDEEEKKQIQKDIKELYEEMIKKAKEEKDKDKIKLYEDALEELEKPRKKK